MDKFIIETNWVDEPPTHWRYLIYQDAEFHTHEAAEAECDVLNAIVASDETLHADVFRLQAKVARLREACKAARKQIEYEYGPGFEDDSRLWNVLNEALAQEVENA